MHRPRQYAHIANAPKSEFFALVAEGMTAVADHTATLVASASRCLDAGDNLAGDILASVAREEAGKFLILLDAARIESRDQQARSSQLKRAGDHLAKSLYFEMSDLSPATLSEVERYFSEARKTHYLDGPNDMDWVFRNRALADREDAMYVDYQETDEGYVWHKPVARGAGWGVRGQQVFDLINALVAAGFADESGLKIVNGIWSGVVPTNGQDGSRDTHWSEIEARNCGTIEALRAGGVDIDARTASLIADRWTFPLHAVELSKVDTAKSIDEEKRRAERAALWDAADYGDIVADLWEDGPADLARDALDAVPDDVLDRRAEMARMKAEYIREERQRFIESE